MTGRPVGHQSAFVRAGLPLCCAVFLLAGCGQNVTATQGETHGSAAGGISRPTHVDPLHSLLAGSRNLGSAGSSSVSVDLAVRSGRARAEAAALAAMYDRCGVLPRASRSVDGKQAEPRAAGEIDFERRLAVGRCASPVRPVASFETPAEVSARYGPPPEHVMAIRRWLNRRGLKVSWTAGSSYVTATGQASSLERAFHVRIDRYARDGTHFLASVSDPRVPRELRGMVLGIGRICTYTWIHAAGVAAGGLSPDGILDAYDIAPLRAQGIDGAGQTVAFPEIDGVDRAAIEQFARLYHLPPFKLTMRGSGLAAGDEATMDVEVVHAIAPAARLVVFNFNGHVSNAGWTHESLGMVRASAGDVISSSVGGCDGTYDATDAADYAGVMTQADLLGESIFASSGDNGAFDCITHGQAPSAAVLGVDMPAALPEVTGVGGTRVSVNARGGWSAETAWEGPIETAGGGGGISRFFRQPAWQNAPGVGLQDTVNSGHMRMVPDVSADADPASGAEIIFPEGAGQGGGTSQAAPIWAGITALIDEYLARNGHHTVGWMNPALYQLARSHPPFAPFHDVTVGSNLFYNAGPGYDMATGLGTPDAWNLARDLVRYQAARGR